MRDSYLSGASCLGLHCRFVTSWCVKGAELHTWSTQLGLGLVGRLGCCELTQTAPTHASHRPCSMGFLAVALSYSPVTHRQLQSLTPPITAPRRSSLPCQDDGGQLSIKAVKRRQAQSRPVNSPDVASARICVQPQT